MKPKVIVVMPAYNAARTLRMTYEKLPKEYVQSVILVDDGSTDETIAIARRIESGSICPHAQLRLRRQSENLLCGSAQGRGRDCGFMVHPDYQNDPTLLPEIIQPIIDGEADLVLGSRLRAGSALEQGMPWWKYYSNRFLTWLENVCFGCITPNTIPAIAPFTARCSKQ